MHQSYYHELKSEQRGYTVAVKRPWNIIDARSWYRPRIGARYGKRLAHDLYWAKVAREHNTFQASLSK